MILGNTHIYLRLVTFLFVISACTSIEESAEYTNALPFFEVLDPAESGVSFKNDLTESIEINGLFHDYYYNGAGVAIADFNNDNLPDIYFVSNVNANKLYLNEGLLKFTDVTDRSGVQGMNGYHTGVSVIDINNDGWLDFYLCRSGAFDSSLTSNLLYINKGNDLDSIPVFEEQSAKYGLDVPFTSTQVAWLDYDGDQDLDAFFSNYGLRPYNNLNMADFINRPSELWGDRLFRNDDGKFIEVSKEAGMINTDLGDGLGVAVGDLNNNGRPDIYLSSDFSDRDHLYINQKNGSFAERIIESTGHTSTYSMGNDIIDINNDGYLDIIVLDMMGSKNYDVKTSMSAMNPELFQMHVDLGLHHQYMYNTLQLNNGLNPRNENIHFSEIAQLSGIASTDWSWSVIGADFDNDGYQDLHVTNGVKRDFRNNDYVTFKKKKTMELERLGRKPSKKEFESYIADLLNAMPVRRTNNFYYLNNTDLTFSNLHGHSIAGDSANISTGAAYADLDLDGDIDIVVNVTDGPAQIIKNNSRDISKNHFVEFELIGGPKNIEAIGSRVTIYYGKNKQIRENYRVRGYMSSSEPIVHFGLKEAMSIDSAVINWYNGRVSRLTNIPADQRLIIDIEETGASVATGYSISPVGNFLFSENVDGLDHLAHDQDSFNDFEEEVLLPHKLSEKGPVMSPHNDGVLVGLGGDNGLVLVDVLNGDKPLELSNELDQLLAHRLQTDLLSIDLNDDGNQDLYIAHGGNQWDEGDSHYGDVLLVQNDNHEYVRLPLPTRAVSTSKVLAHDIDDDQDLDLLVFAYNTPRKYPQAPTSYILMNQLSETGQLGFIEAHNALSEAFSELGMVTDAIIADIDGDRFDELVIVGEWMPLTIFEIAEGNNMKSTVANSSGWWKTIDAADFDLDGDIDLIAGNMGLNYKYKASISEPFIINASDFDNNGSWDIALGFHEQGELYPLRGRECSSQQLPGIKQKFPNYDLFAQASYAEVYGELSSNDEGIVHREVQTFANTYFENTGKRFEAKALPNQAQIANINTLNMIDLNHDGYLDIVAAGNFYQSEVETPRIDASCGTILINDQNGFFDVLSPYNSGMYLTGDIKSSSLIESADGDIHLLVGRLKGSLGLWSLNNRYE